MGFAIFAFGLLLLDTTPAQAQIIYENDFEQYSAAQLYTDDDLDTDWSDPVFNDGVTEGRVSIVNGAEAFGGAGSAMSVFYPAGSDGTKDTGAQWKYELGGEYEEVFLSYRIKFKSGFDFVRGGKLPGLAGGSAPTGSTTADGVNGWTGRMMWRTDFTGDSGDPEQLTAEGISYAKYTHSGFAQDGTQEDKAYWTGADGARTVLHSGVWYKVAQRVKMNTPGAFDGVLQIWIDGELVLDQQDLRFRLVNDLKIDQMYFSTFFGGNEDWATSKDETVYFDDFQISIPSPTYLKVPQHYDTIQAAIDAASPGDVVSIKGNRTENIIVDKPIFVRGYTGTRLFAADSSLPAITVTSNEVHLKRIEVHDAKEGVLVKSGRTGVQVEYMKVYDCQTGIKVESGCDNARVWKCTTFRSANEGTRIDDSDSCAVYNNKAYQNTGDAFSFNNCTNFEIYWNTAQSNHANGFTINGPDHNTYDNRAFNNQGIGFSLSQGNQIFVDNTARTNKSHGYFFDAVDNSLIDANVCSNNRGAGFFLSLGSDDTTVTSNTSRRNWISGFLVQSADGTYDANNADDNRQDGFLFTDDSANNSVTNNNSEDNRGFGFLDQGTGNTFGGNTESDNGN
jgi:nitrous oxidase accessory protein NosD